ncbi:CRTAC1 family protein [Tundrisphaera lichenicola]|uniref:CRTAC1 family protein n=1 Tax=Tundrisphaera lichenicola TaxID=2029860 RepID=UPI003EBAEE01
MIGAFLTLLASMAAAPPEGSPLVFRDVAAEAGVSFRFEAGSRGLHDLPEIMGGGVVLIDFDGDGRLDIYLCNGGPIVPEAGRPDPPCRLFRNEGDWRFLDVTDRAGAPGPSYAMGASVGDFDGDGLDDLFVTGWRDQRLYRNAGLGKFEDVTDRAGVGSDLWSTSAAFADLDGDGDLDLYVAAYLDFDPAFAPFCAAPDGKRDYCGPEGFAAQPDRLYQNDGDGTFTDVSKDSGVDRPGGRGLGVVVGDLVGDRGLDIFVANDGTACRLFENRGGLRFEEVGLASGVALDGRGDALAGMGVALGDIDGDGLDDLVVGNFLGRSTIGFRAIGGGMFLDDSDGLGLSTTRVVLGFGLALADFDLDGRLDLLQANGHVLDRARLGQPFAMRPTLLRNRGGRLADVTPEAGPWFARPILGRGLAVGDLDGDGRIDAVVNALDAPAAVLRNISEAGRSLRLDLIGRHPSPRSAIGAKVRATFGGRTLSRIVLGGGGYLSSSDRSMILGLGDSEGVDRLEVTWPSGRVETWRDLKAGRLKIEEGTAPR